MAKAKRGSKLGPKKEAEQQADTSNTGSTPDGAGEQNTDGNLFGSSMSRRSVLKAMGVSAGALGLDLPRSLVPKPPEQTAGTGSPATGVDKSGAGSPPGELASTDSAAAKIVSVADGEFLTTKTGTRISDDQNTLRAGERGPSLLEDFHYREKMTQFDHERIPERVVHARGTGAHGYFQVYKPMTQYTRARFLQDPAVKTPVFVRFSTINGFRGSADTVRDARGFATRFYTEEGIFDLVGNNIPVFFIQDAIKFPDLVHSFKPEPDLEIPQASTAHNTFWDFISLTPESMHMVMWVMSDRALPRSFAMMDGFGIHTFRLVNAEGKSTFVKFHWRSPLGAHSLVWDEAQKLAGKDPDFNRRDLYENIEMGNFPEFELGFQLVAEEDAGKFDFDLLDPTKIIPEDLVPVTPVGKMTLNKGPENFFEEVEQAAFHLGHIVSGIDVSDDPLLQGRLFSYLDTQINRFGTPNFTQLPINQPRSPVNNFQQDGFMRYANRPGKINYEPNSIGPETKNAPLPKEASAEQGGFVSYPEPITGNKVRARSKSFGDHFSQATLFYNSMSQPEKDHITQALQFELGRVTSKQVQQRMVDLLANVDTQLASDVGGYIGVTPKPGKPNTQVGKAKGLSQLEEVKNTPKGRKIAILVGDGFNGAEVAALRAAAKQQGASTEVVGTHLGIMKSAEGQEVPADKSLLTAESVFYDGVFVPGGAESAKALAGNAEAVHFVREAFKHYKPLGSSGEGAQVFQAAGMKGDEPGVVSGPNAILEAVGKHRFWDRATAKLMPA